MSLYEELNELKMDVTQFEQKDLSKTEKRLWEKRILKKIRKRHPLGNWIVTSAVAVVSMVVLSVSTGLVSVADMPFVGGKIEEYLNFVDPADYSAYKTEIGETAENAYGKLTLNEVMFDEGRLLINSTFEPADGVHFDYQMHPMPTVLINGENVTSYMGGESIERNSSMFSVYNEITLKEMEMGDSVQVHISYDRLDLDMTMEQPWVFDIQVPTSQLAAQSIPFNQEITIGDASITLEKIVITPISTVVYYLWTEESNHIAFKIINEKGTEILPSTIHVNEEQSTNRFEGTELQKGMYYLVPYEQSVNYNAEHPGEVPDVKIPFNIQ